MGYYTRFELEVISEGISTYDFLEKLEETDEEHNLVWAVEKYGSSNGEIKWYHHEEEMIELSKVNPGVLFKLKGEGEENDDMWVKYFKDGKVQQCRAVVTFEEYDENKLK